MSSSDSSDGRMRRASKVSQRRRLRSVSILLIGGVLAAVVSACGSSDDPAQTPNSLTPVKFATVASAVSVPVFVADKQGFFEDEGLDATVEVFPTSATPLVMSGQVDFGITATSQVDQQRSNNVPIKMVAGLDYVDGKDSSQAGGLVVQDDSAIRSASDLAGKTVALPGVKNGPELVMRKWLNLKGVDPSTVKFVSLTLPDQIAALKAGDVDAALEFEPFLAKSQQEGNRVLAYPYAEATPDVTGVVLFASDKYLQSHPDIAAKVVRALDKASAYANAHPDEVRTLLTEIAKVPAELASAMNIPQYRTDIDVQGVEDELGQMVELGWIEDRPSPEDLIWSDE